MKRDSIDEGIAYAVLVAVLIGVFVTVFLVMKRGNSAENVSANFGKATVSLIASGKYALACEDAKAIVSMIGDISVDIAKNPELAENISPNNMSPAMKRYENAMNGFARMLEVESKDDRSVMSAIVEGIGEGISSLFQVSVMTYNGMIEEDVFDEFIDVTYCGAQQREGYVSPLDMDIRSLMVPPSTQAPEGNPAQ